MSYLDHFRKTCEYNWNLVGLSPFTDFANGNWTPRNASNCEKIRGYAFELLESANLEDLEFKCAHITIGLKQKILERGMSDGFSVKKWITVGDVQDSSGKSAFRLTEQKIDQWVKDKSSGGKGAEGSDRLFHVWLTTEYGDIYDLTYYASYSNPPRKMPVIGDAEKIAEPQVHGLHYIPMGFGLEFLAAIGAIKLSEFKQQYSNFSFDFS
jgi:hypothetical protein